MNWCKFSIMKGCLHSCKFSLDSVKFVGSGFMPDGCQDAGNARTLAYAK